MTKTEIAEMYARNMKRLTTEVEAYPDDASLWKVVGSITNSGGNLALHLIGNVNHFIGSTLGKTNYVRNRDAEFNTKDLTKTELIKMLDEATEQVTNTLSELSENDLQQDYPFEFGGKHSTAYYLIFFIAHFEYHLGQINYHRRMIV